MYKRQVTIIAAMLVSMQVAAAPELQGVAMGSSDGLDGFVEQQMAQTGIVGLAGAIILDREVVWMRGYGFADKQRGVPFTPDTIMNIGSISKTVTGAALMHAVQEGKLDLDTDVNEYLPFKVVNPNFPEEPITLRQLATHTSGLPRNPPNLQRVVNQDAAVAVNPFGNFAMFHVTTPDESVLRTTKSDLPIRFSGSGGARIEVAQGTYIIPMGLYMRQGNDQMINAGLTSEIGIAGTPYSAVVGCSYRVKDAVIAQVGLKHSNAAFRFSYDINVSPLRNYTRKNGAFEFSILYYGSHSGRQRRITSSAF